MTDISLTRYGDCTRCMLIRSNCRYRFCNNCTVTDCSFGGGVLVEVVLVEVVLVEVVLVVVYILLLAEAC